MSASTFIGELVIAFFMAYVFVWVLMKAAEILCFIWKWIKEVDDRMIAKMAMGRARKQLSGMTNEQKDELYEELLQKQRNSE